MIKPRRKGVAIYIVLLIMVSLSVLVFYMIQTSGQSRQVSGYMGQKVVTRMAAEGAAAVILADVQQKGSDIFAVDPHYQFVPETVVVNNVTAVSTAKFNGSNGITTMASGPLTGLKGLEYPVTMSVKARGVDGSTTKMSQELQMYQVPILQFGEFDDGGNSLAPGGNQSSRGPFHTNGSLTFSPGKVLDMQGPVTAAGPIRWQKNTTSTDIVIWQDGISNATVWHAPFGSVALKGYVDLTEANGPTAVGEYKALRQNVPKLVLPLGTGKTITDLYPPCQVNDGVALKRQKFDCITLDPTKASSASRFIASPTVVRPSWIKGPYRFFHRAAWRWMKYWTFDLSLLAASGNKDSIFYLADMTTDLDKGALQQPVLAGFVLVNGATLDRNITIASANELYIQGDYNTGIPRRHSLVAAYRVVNLSQNWGASPGNDTALQRGPYSDPVWTEPKIHSMASDSLPSCWNPAGTGLGVSIGSGIKRILNGFTGTLPTTSTGCGTTGTGTRADTAKCKYASDGLSTYANSVCNHTVFGWSMATNTTQNTCILGIYGELLENWSNLTLTVQGSFIVPVMNTAIGNRIHLTEKGSGSATGTGLMTYFPPTTRAFLFDTAYKDLNNMPPATPFLSVLSQVQWKDDR